MKSSLFQQTALWQIPYTKISLSLRNSFGCYCFLFLNFFIPLTNFIGTHFHFSLLLLLRPSSRRRFCIVKSPAEKQCGRLPIVHLSDFSFFYKMIITIFFKPILSTKDFYLEHFYYYVCSTFNEVVIIIAKELKRNIQAENISLTNLYTAKYLKSRKKSLIYTYAIMTWCEKK